MEQGWRSLDQVELATAEWVDWYNTGDDTFRTTDGPQTVNFAQIANERNGVFFGKGEGDD